MTRLTKPQQRSLHSLWTRSSQSKSYLAFRRTVLKEFGGSAVMVRWCNMWIGIEPDGYTHS